MQLDTLHRFQSLNDAEDRKRSEVFIMKWYKAELEDDNFEMILAEDDADALQQAFELEEEINNALFGLYEVDDDYNNIKTIL